MIADNRGPIYPDQTSEPEVVKDRPTDENGDPSFVGQAGSVFYGRDADETFRALSQPFDSTGKRVSKDLTPFLIPDYPATLRFDSGKAGPELILSAGLHGNEYQPITALLAISRALVDDPSRLKRGSLILTLGNLAALEEGKRFIPPGIALEHTLGDELGGAVRHGVENVLKKTAPSLLNPESRDLNRLFGPGAPEGDSRLLQDRDRLRKLIEGSYPGAPTDGRDRYYRDFHTMSKAGEPVVLCETNDWKDALSLGISKVVYGVEKAIDTGSMSFATKVERMRSALVLEAGKHDLASSAIAPLIATYNTLRKLDMDGGFPPLEEVLQSIGLTSLSKNEVPEQELYSMEGIIVKKCDTMEFVREFKNFDFIKAGELVAREKGREVRAPYDAYILMPTPPEIQNIGDEVMFLLKKMPIPQEYSR